MLFMSCWDIFNCQKFFLHRELQFNPLQILLFPSSMCKSYLNAKYSYSVLRQAIAYSLLNISVFCHCFQTLYYHNNSFSDGLHLANTYLKADTVYLERWCHLYSSSGHYKSVATAVLLWACDETKSLNFVHTFCSLIYLSFYG